MLWEPARHPLRFGCQLSGASEALRNAKRDSAASHFSNLAIYLSITQISYQTGQNHIGDVSQFSMPVEMPETNARKGSQSISRADFDCFYQANRRNNSFQSLPRRSRSDPPAGYIKLTGQKETGNSGLNTTVNPQPACADYRPGPDGQQKDRPGVGEGSVWFDGGHISAQISCRRDLYPMPFVQASSGSLGKRTPGPLGVMGVSRPAPG